ncbi:MAG: T9SS type A sorting domain-containing protein [Prolixibacteraceae bacterium]|nr:T9SS type A sorting domain-containing protein [Prolixibacteraceae bacterium]
MTLSLLVKVKTWETGLYTTCNCGYCFEINIPNFTKDSVIVTFDGEIISSSLANTVEQKIGNLDFNVYPNPANNTLTITGKEIDSYDFNYKVFDTEGRIIKVGKINGESQIDITKRL